MTRFVYCVYCEDQPEAICFETEAEAMGLARTYANCRVDKNEVDEDGTLLGTETIYKAETEELGGNAEFATGDNPFAIDFPKSDIEDITGSDDESYDEMANFYLYGPELPADFDDPKRGLRKTEDFDIKEAVKNMEEHEDEVECKCCFDLFPKAECVRTKDGYVCKKCDQELHSHQGTNLDLIDDDSKDL